MHEREFNLSLLAKEKQLVPLSSNGPKDVRVVIGYPNRYWLAMSNLGFQTVFKIFSAHSRLKVERAFLPEKDLSTCRTFESDTPLSSAEILALSVSFETDYLYVLYLLEQAGMDLNNPRESTGRPLILGGGAALTLNPEPLANFFDAIVIGEGEEVIGEITECYLQSRDSGESFSELLVRLAQLEGVYVPSLYDVEFNADNTIKRYIPNATESIPARINRRIVQDINKFPSYTVIQTPETEFKAMFMTETGRGCEVGCKFCVAGYMYRPTRKRSEESIKETLEIGLEKSESVGFVGAAVSSHRAITSLVKVVTDSGKRASLSSIMSQRVSPELASGLSESEYKTVALAPEAGSEDLRFRIGKRVPDSQIVRAVETLAENGIRNFKLYLMVGLPSETDEDVRAIPALVATLRDAVLRGARRQENFTIAPKIYLSVNPFIPKAWTPFQRHTFLEMKELKRRLEIIRKAAAKLSGVEMKNESPRESYFQVLVSRGDRRVGELLREMYQRDEDWRWLVKHGDEQILENVPPADFYVYRTFGKEEVMPWESVDLNIKRSLLEKLYEETFTTDVQPVVERKIEYFNSKFDSLEVSV
jgi:radical SAM superfamily enzyme YgiQ (UPF0313 family)